MRLKAPLFIVILIVLGSTWVLWRHAHRDERIIHRQLDQLHALLEKKSDQKPLNRLVQAQRVASFFSPEATIDLRPTISYPFKKEALPPLYMQVHNQVDRLLIHVTDRRLRLDRKQGLATMRLTASASAEIRGEREYNVYEFELKWVKHEGTWLIAAVTQIQGIRPPG